MAKIGLLGWIHTKLTVKGNVGKLHQAFLNILTNAFQSIENKGMIEITTLQKTKHVTIKISDTGHGIDEEILPKITDPFFTTKAPGKGTGLGLSITNAIITNHRGSLRFTSEKGKGTIAIVKLPAS